MQEIFDWIMANWGKIVEFVDKFVALIVEIAE